MVFLMLFLTNLLIHQATWLMNLAAVCEIAAFALNVYDRFTK